MRKHLSFVLAGVLLVLFWELITPQAHAQPQIAPHAIELSVEQEQREHELNKRLRCLVCQNQSIAESGAGLADDLKAEVRLQLSLGKSDDEVVQHMVDRYGDFINYNPPLNRQTLLLWAGPAVILLLMLLLLVRAIKRQSAGLSMKDSEDVE